MLMDLFTIGAIIWLDNDAQAPDGTFEANGWPCLISSFEALYSIIQTRYGGNNRNFNLPDLRPKMADGSPDPNWNNGPKAFIRYNGIYPDPDKHSELINIIDDILLRNKL